jgi:hypothetical protein
MNNQKQEITAVLARLLGSFPATAADADMLLDGFLMATSDIPSRFVAKAAKEFLSGEIDGQNLTFAPTPAQLANRARKHWDTAAKARALEDRRNQQLLASGHEISMVERQRNQHRFAEIIANIADNSLTDDAERDRKKTARKKFVPDMESGALSARLMGNREAAE